MIFEHFSGEKRYSVYSPVSRVILFRILIIILISYFSVHDFLLCFADGAWELYVQDGWQGRIDTHTAVTRHHKCTPTIQRFPEENFMLIRQIGQGWVGLGEIGPVSFNNVPCGWTNRVYLYFWTVLSLFSSSPQICTYSLEMGGRN